MEPDPLREQIMKLHAELGAADRVDPRSKQLLAEIMDDIKRLMERPAAAESTLPDRLEAVAVQFEVDHPTLAASSRRLVDLLEKVGL